MLKTFEKILFLKNKSIIKLGIEQNQILPDEVQEQIDIAKGI
jgi:hypothetical protein